MALKKRCSSYLALLTLISCSGGEVRSQKLEESYRTSGVEQYFLPELPAWANYSTAGRCYKSNSFQYLDFQKIKVNFQLSYLQMVELQAQYNQRRETYFSTTAYRFLKPAEEAAFFSNTLEQVRGGVRQFKLPHAPRVEIIWLESYVQQNKTAEIHKLAASDRFNENVPVIFSSCLSSQRLEQWVQEQKLDEVGFYILGAEWLSPYSSTGIPHAGLRLEILPLLNPGSKATILVPDNSITPLELNL